MFYKDRGEEVSRMENRLRELRKKRRLTQVGLQMQTGIEQTLISKYERGERVPPTETLMVLAKFFGTTMDYIMCLTDNPQRPPPLGREPAPDKEKPGASKFSKST
ncbi:XRE family transcriptional regulator [Neglecta sp. X4]|jgi:transcriptional regulator with XRE-family HTH domain|nr:XRE family transcriptional regulator [Neglectibacter sp. 59]NBJ72711.1 XRE family transcriptional regulator [Neglectibacter sp. X4]NCE80309.1 XRE family transcriptional regulator [Neglectibacter sp. X58]